MILCVISMFIYACECIGLRNIVIMMYMYDGNDLNLNLDLNTKCYFWKGFSLRAVTCGNSS